MNLPPENCFTEDEVGFVPIYSLNSNHKSTTALDVDMEAYAALWEYSFNSLSVRGRKKHTVGPHHTESSKDGPIDHPILSSIEPRHGQKHHAEILEVLFESLSAPAAYLAPSATLSAFTFGRQSALVVDVGHSSTKVTPVMDGYTLNSGSVISERGGEWLGRAQQKILTCEDLWNEVPCHEVTPRYILRSKDDNLHKLKLLKKSSFHRMTVHEIMYEMMTGSHILPLTGDSSTGTELFKTNIQDEPKPMVDDDVEEVGLEYVLPDGTKVDIGSTTTGKDLCHLPVRQYLHIKFI